MTTTLALTERHAAFRAELVEAGLLVPMGENGLYGRGADFERVVEGIDNLVTRRGADQNALRVRFPPVFDRAVFEKTDYLASFPDLTGGITGFTGGDREHAALLAMRERGEDWRAALEPTDMMLVSAACHPLYPSLSGTLPPGGRRADVLGQCFRHEPSVDPARMQSFRMREYVYVGDPDSALAHRDGWIPRGLAVLEDLGLVAEAVVANDPFFGRAGRMLAANQRSANLKTELVVRLYGDDEDSGSGTAVVSANYHMDHFGVPFGISTADGAVAHSACVGFGLERITLALLRTHGLDPASWPSPVRAHLFGEAP
jgi:seryl-tRNA synthetase